MLLLLLLLLVVPLQMQLGGDYKAFQSASQLLKPVSVEPGCPGDYSLHQSLPLVRGVSHRSVDILDARVLEQRMMLCEALQIFLQA